MKIVYTLDFFKENFSDIHAWYRHNYRKLAPKKRRLWKNILDIVANLMVVDINKERGYPKEWREKYIKNIQKAEEDLLELSQTHRSKTK